MTQALSGVLVIQTAFLGDVALTTPLICAASARFAPLKVSLLAIPSGAAACGYPANPIDGLSEILVYDKRGKDSGALNFLKLAGTLKERRFDVALVPHRSHRSAALAYLAGIPVRVGFDENAFGPLFTHRVPRRRDIHEVERNLALLEPFGGPPAGFVPKLIVSIPDDAKERAAALCGTNSPLVGIGPGSVWGTKRWMPEGFARVMDSLSDETGASFVIVGGPGDADAAHKVASLTKAKVINLAGKTTIPEMMAVIERLDLFITNDTGPMHVAVALDVPVVAIFGATVPALGFAPYTKKARVVEPPLTLECRPCSAHGPKSCPEGHFKCMMEIKPNGVVDAAKELIGTKL